LHDEEEIQDFFSKDGTHGCQMREKRIERTMIHHVEPTALQSFFPGSPDVEAMEAVGFLFDPAF
jgi:hypothetical protein